MTLNWRQLYANAAQFRIQDSEKINKRKLLISNQHGALVMALLPFLIGMIKGGATHWHFVFLLAWLALYLFSYPFLAMFNKKEKSKYQYWSIVYGAAALFFLTPLLSYFPVLALFLLACLPLVGVSAYFAWKRDERHLLNDCAGIALFGVIGMASFYLSAEQLNFAVFWYPFCFFFATTIYIKSVARERKNPRYFWLSLALHLAGALAYAWAGDYALSAVYGLALLRAAYVPSQKWSIKQIGLFEFAIEALFFVALCFTPFRF